MRLAARNCFVRLIIFAIAFLLYGCANVKEITHYSCIEPLVPPEVNSKRETYLYVIDGERDISLWDSPLRYGQGVDSAGKMIIHYPPPLHTLPVGTRMTIVRVTRETRFENTPNSIRVFGTVDIDSKPIRFAYLWGLENRVILAPWESEVYQPRARARLLDCVR